MGTANELLEREGAEGFSASRLAREVGVGKATLFTISGPSTMCSIWTERMVEGVTPSGTDLPKLPGDGANGAPVIDRGMEITEIKVGK